MEQVFISYSKENETEAKELCNKLNKKFPNIAPWIDRVYLLPGQNWKVEIAKAISESQFFITLLSKKSVEKIGYFQQELKIAQAKALLYPVGKIFIIPIRLEKCEVPPGLEEYQYLDLFPNWEEALNKLYCVFSKAPEYLDRIDRTNSLVEELEDIYKICETNKKKIVIRMRTAFTSMTNIRHYHGKDIDGLLPEQASLLDNLLIKEREILVKLLEMDNVELKCICYPNMNFLKEPYYLEDEKAERKKLFTNFILKSQNEYKHNRDIVKSKAASYGNQIFIGNRIAFIAEPSSGGYRKTLIFKDTSVVNTLNNEYDNLFKQIKENLTNNDIF